MDIYSRITDRIVEDLARGVKPWMKPWHDGNLQGRITRPLRHNGQPYSGMNVLLLWSEGMARGFSSPMWMTFKQSLELGAAVRKARPGRPSSSPAALPRPKPMAAAVRSIAKSPS
ncbi:unnamed protein product [Ciceribacter sp. T2.26MG-112.2]|nr:unnamed protein product [Ciceribacter naphthalenivorans]